MILEPYRSRSLNVLLAGLAQRDTHEWEILASNFYGGWGEESFEFILEERVVGKEAELEAAKARLRARQAYAIERYHDKETVALKSWEYEGDNLRASFVPSDDLTYLAYREMEGAKGSIPLGCSALEVNFFVVTHDNFVLLAQGTDKRSFACSARAGMGEVRDGKIDAVGAACRGAREELGLRLARNSVVFNGWGVHRQEGQCALWGLVYIEQDWSELWLGDDRWQRVSAIPFEVEACLRAMAEGQWEYGALLGLLEALIYKHGLDTVFETARAQANSPIEKTGRKS